MRTLLILLAFLPAFYSHSQTYNPWSVDVNLGLNSALGPFAEGCQSNYLGIYHADANARYMFSNKFGVTWGLGFDRIKNDESGGYTSDFDFKVHYIRTSLQAVFNVGRIAEFEKINERMGLLLHAGIGFSSMKNAHNSIWFSDWKTQGADEMAHLLIGFTPQIQMGDHFAIHMDFTYVANIWQTITFDFTTPNEFHKGVDGKLVSFSLGASYYFGKDGAEKKHLDWVWDDSTPMGNPGDTIIRRETTTTTETVVVNGDTTSAKVPVDPYAPNEDFDGDGVINSADACPTTYGEDPNGCPSADRDGDGIANTIDDCPDVPGVAENGGCPKLDSETDDALIEAVKNVDFESGTTELKETSAPYLDKIVAILKEHPEYILAIHCHTDNRGESGPNLSLSNARAESLSEYFASKGIAAERLKPKGFGGTKPIAANTSPEGRKRNTRIELKIEFQ